MLSLHQLKERYRALKFGIKDFNLRGTLTLAATLRQFLSVPTTVQSAEQELQQALESREARFLDLVRARVYERPASPYLKLLQRAGCEFADLQAAVRRGGLEPALERLAAEGVYLTAREAKGKDEVKRGALSFRVDPNDLMNTELIPSYVSQSSGTSNRPLLSPSSLDLVAQSAAGRSIFFAAHGLYDYSHAIYEATLPSGGGIRSLLQHAKMGVPTDRWFARKAPTNTGLGKWYHDLTTRLIVSIGRRYASGLPRPEYLDIEEIPRIVSWALEKKREGKACCITTAASNAVRIARAALEIGVALDGTKFIAGGEPLTEAKREIIARAGAAAIPSYGFEDLGLMVGYGCGRPAYTDEMHVSRHMLAMIEHARPVAQDSVDIRPLLFTAINPLTVRFFLNVENGDYATLATRDCGCALEKVGFKLHLHRIRSYEKLTSEGMNYFYRDLFELFEKTLPSEFGGGPGDYQLVEEEDHTGLTRLTLVVHPEVGGVDEDRLLARLKELLAEGPQGNRFTIELWQKAGTFRVQRRIPYSSRRGKVVPVHILRA
jgi:hypothetical protein